MRECILCFQDDNDVDERSRVFSYIGTPLKLQNYGNALCLQEVVRSSMHFCLFVSRVFIT